MIQRIQSIWLLLAASAATLALKLPFYYGTKNEFEKEYPLTGLETPWLIITSVVIITLSLVCIFLYKNRRLQFRLTLLAFFLDILLLFLFFQQSKTFMKGTLALTSLLPVFCLLFLFLAARGIRSDAKIIAESERLR
jgi:cytochrome bd-type quinol oxidase subunit 2